MGWNPLPRIRLSAADARVSNTAWHQWVETAGGVRRGYHKALDISDHIGLGAGRHHNLTVHSDRYFDQIGDGLSSAEVDIGRQGWCDASRIYLEDPCCERLRDRNVEEDGGCTR